MAKFKVGDRVRMTREIDGHKADCPATIIFDGGGAYRPLAIKFDGPQGWAHSAAGMTDDRFGYWVEPDAIEPLPVAAPAQPAPLTIEAGKFYKTRDGRKVGPIKRHSTGDRYWEATEFLLSGYGSFWCENGSFYPGREYKHDLIAEWVDEPAEQPAVAVTASNDNAAPAKFKVGDRVITKAGYTFDGSPGVIAGVSEDDDDLFHVKIDNHPDARSHKWSVRSNDMIAIPAPTATAIVALIEDGQPKPASRPFVHYSVEAATTEATRLAGIHRGKQFGIYVLADTREADKPAYDHEWQNLAASGEKIQAIKALKSLTGMGLKPAKDAVEYFLAAA